MSNRKPITPTALRANLYRVLDEVLETGLPVEIQRGGRILTLAALEKSDRFSRLRPHPGAMDGDPESLVEIDWSHEWKP